MPPPDRSAALESRPVAPSTTRLGSLDASDPTEVRVGELSRGLDRLQTRQAESLNRLEEVYDGTQARVRTVLSDLGVSAPPPSLAKRVLAIGGPLLPFVSSEDPFERQMARVRANAGTMAELGQLIDRVPVRRPVPPGAEVTSGFGPRLDPFVKQYAFHSGIDLKGEPGDMARATAAGRVTTAGYQGGYGLLVEIDHGNGLATRYGHLSAIDVSEGQIVESRRAGRPHRHHRALHRPASALRGADRRRAGRPPALFAGRRQAQRTRRKRSKSKRTRSGDRVLNCRAIGGKGAVGRCPTGSHAANTI